MFYFDPKVQNVINIELKHIKGQENKDDARQDAYHEIADTGPITVEDACACARRAINTFRQRLGRTSKREREYTGYIGMTDMHGKRIDEPIDYDIDIDEDGEDIEPIKTSWIDYVQPNTDSPPRHGKKHFMALYRETCKQMEQEKLKA
jgi:hypothetical protein